MIIYIRYPCSRYNETIFIIIGFRFWKWKIKSEIIFTIQKSLNSKRQLSTLFFTFIEQIFY